MVISIDGTSGSGKSTIAKLVADALGFNLLNTGLLYRLIAKHCLDHGINLDNELKVVKITDKIDYNDINQYLHDEEISKAVPIISKHEKVRRIVRKWQRDIVKDKNYVVEGRDIGSVVFPNASIKLFITATLEERARRRFLQLQNKDNVDIEDIKKNIKNRDSHDEMRSNSPLVIPDDAIVINTTEKTINEVLNELMKEINMNCPTNGST